MTSAVPGGPAVAAPGPGRLVAVCRVQDLHADAGPVGVTAIDKRAVQGRVPVRRLGLWGDVQADRKHHGGLDKALYAFDRAEAEHWSAELGRAVPPGAVGENLLIAGLAVDDAEIGELWSVGPEVEVEVTGPRTPCATFARWLGEPGFVPRFTARARPGAYLRVVTTGEVGAGDVVTVTRRPGHGVTVAQVLAGLTPAAAGALLDAEAAGLVRLADYLRRPVGASARR